MTPQPPDIQGDPDMPERERRLLQLARDVAAHFADTDAPLGQRARDLVAAYDRSRT